MKLTKLFALSAVLAPVVLAATLSPDALANQSKSPKELRFEMQAQIAQYAQLQQDTDEMLDKRQAEADAEFMADVKTNLDQLKTEQKFDAPVIDAPVISLNLEKIVTEPPRENYVGRQLSVVEAKTEREIADPEEANKIADSSIIPEVLTLDQLAEIALNHATGEAQREVAAKDTEKDATVDKVEVTDDKPAVVVNQIPTQQIADQLVTQDTSEKMEKTDKPVVGSVVIDEANDTKAEKIKAAEAAEAERLAQEEAEKVKAAEAAEAERLAQEEAEKVKAAEAAEAERLAQVEAEKEKTEIAEQVAQVAGDANKLLDKASKDSIDEGDAQRIAAAIAEVEDKAEVLEAEVEDEAASEDELSELKVELEDAKKQLAQAKEKLSEKDKKFAKLEEKNEALTNAYCEQKTDYLELSNKIESFETSFLGGINEKFDMLTQLLTMNLLAQQGPQTPSLYNFNPGLSRSNPRLQNFGLENGLRLATLNDFFDSRSLRNNMMNGNTTVYNVKGDFYAGGYMHNPVEGGFYNGDYTYQHGFQTPAAGSLNYPTVNTQPFAYDFASGINDGQRAVGQQDTFAVNQPVVNRSMIEANVQRMNGGQQIFQRQPTAQAQPAIQAQPTAQSQREQNVVR
ncbi:MAG: hypothetical protein VYA54_06865 [Bdellovibrionota bacterium]|nr:hypothetical protein [Bdellovibrionota bacterium]